MNRLYTLIFLAGMGISLFSCNKKSDSDVEPINLQLDISRHDFRHERYYELKHGERSIEVNFDKVIDTESLAGNISFSDLNGDLTSMIEFAPASDQLLIAFRPELNIRPGWKYELNISTGLRSEDGLTLPEETILEFRTGMADPSGDPPPANGMTGRNAIAIISDIHMGDQRAYDNDYCWFGKNKEALEAFLHYVNDSNVVKQLVILGDLFDEWLVPYTISPFDSSQQITTTATFFKAVSEAGVNSSIFEGLRSIANNPDVDLIYVPGNHDMLGNPDILLDLIPGIATAYGPDGLGKYSPFPEMIFEHGHRYDFFNCPQPLVNPDHMLPPGYFVSRLYAKGMMDASGSDKSVMETTGSLEFTAAWDVAFLYTIAHFLMTPPDVFSKNILMGGIDGYTEAMSFHGTREMYAENIEDFWPATQTQNAVPVPSECCFHAIWNGHSDLYSAATDQYMSAPPSPHTYKIVSFGHTHEAMLKVFPEGSSYTSIYANSGTWIDADQCSYKTRTYLLIHPTAWTGSELDIVGLYQYNLQSDGEYGPSLITEESID